MTAKPTPTATSTPAPTPTPTPTPETDSDRSWSVTVVEVVDGDTVDIAFANGTTERIRLLGVDTPEVHVEVQPNDYRGISDTPAARDCLRTYGENASSYASQRLQGETVTLQLDPDSDTRGSFGRLLGYILVDGENFNHDLVATGRARVYVSTFAQFDRFQASERVAQEQNRGVWSCRGAGDSTTETPDGSADSGALTVSDIHADAAGNDHENLNDEYISFRNTDDETLDLGGWRVEDAADHSFVFPSGTTLEAGETITLRTGSGTDSDSDVYWGSGRAIWNNSGDTIYVYTSDGVLVVEQTY
jgi:micrococcal nuclease